MVNKSVAMTLLVAATAFGFAGCETSADPKEASSQASPAVAKSNAAKPVATDSNAIKPLVLKAKTDSKVTYSGTTTVSGTAKYNEYSCELCLHVDDKSRAMIPTPSLDGRDNRIFAIGEDHRAKLGFDESVIGEGKGCYTQELKVQITDYKIPVSEEAAFDSATVVKVIDKGALKEVSCD